MSKEIAQTFSGIARDADEAIAHGTAAPTLPLIIQAATAYVLASEGHPLTTEDSAALYEVSPELHQEALAKREANLGGPDRSKHWRAELQRMFADVDASNGEVGTHEAIVHLLVGAEQAARRGPGVTIGTSIVVEDSDSVIVDPLLSAISPRTFIVWREAATYQNEMDLQPLVCDSAEAAAEEFARIAWLQYEKANRVALDLREATRPKGADDSTREIGDKVRVVDTVSMEWFAFEVAAGLSAAAKGIVAKIGDPAPSEEDRASMRDSRKPPAEA